MGADAPLTERTNWGNPIYWGEGLKNKKPETKADLVAQFQSWVFVCAKLNADAIASVPLCLYVQKQAKGQKFKTIETRPIDKARLKWLASNSNLANRIAKAVEIEEVTEHVFLDLMRNVNPFMNASDLRELTSIFLDLTGEAYWYIPKGKRMKQPMQIWPIPSQYMKPIPGEKLEEFIKGWEYERGSQRATFELDEIIDFKFPSPLNQLGGYGCVKGVTDAIFVNSKMYEFEEALFANKARTSGVMEASSDIQQAEVDRFRLDWQQRYVGTDKAGATPILPPGVKFVRDSMTMEELSFIEGRKVTREEVAAGFGTPIALWDKTAIRANVEAALYFHAKFGIMPRLRKIEEKINERFLPLFDEKLFCAFEDPVPANAEFELQERKAYVETGIISRDEAREELGRETVGGGADELWVPFNYVPISGGGQQAEERAAEKLYAKTLRKIKEKLRE
jgi:HK97 family phage portal protein